MAFPDDPLDLTVTIAFDGTTPVDVSEHVRNAEQLHKDFGRGESAISADPSKVTFRLQAPEDDPGLFNPDNAAGTHWQPLGWLGCPVVAMLEGEDAGDAWYTGRISAMNPEWDQDGDAYLSVEVQGDAFWLTQTAPVLSALKRTTIRNNPVAYWPLDDGRNATVGGTPLADTHAANHANAKFGEVDGPPGAPEKLPELAAATVSAVPVLAGQVATDTDDSWALDLVIRAVPVSATSASIQPMRWSTNGTASQWTLTASITGGSPLVRVTASGPVGVGVGVIVDVSSATSIFDEQWHHIRVRVWDLAGTIETKLYIDGDEVDDNVDSTYAGALTNLQVYAVSDAQVSSASVGHLTVYDGDHAAATVFDAWTGYVGEEARVRVLRLADEEYVTITVVADTGSTALMGVQPTADIMTLLRECETADQARIDDACGPIRFVGRKQRYNASPAISLDASALRVAPSPRHEIGYRTGRVEVTRDGGATMVADATDVLDAGGTTATAQVSAANDGSILALAQWILGQGKTPGPRTTRIELDLTAPNCTLTLADWRALAEPVRATVTGIPGWPDGMNVFVEGGSEDYTLVDGVLALNVTPARQYDVFRRGDRRDGAHSTIAVAIDDAATALSVSTWQGSKWTTDAGAVPLDIDLYGERCTATAIVGTGMTAYVAVGASAHANNASVTPALPAGWAAGDLLVVVAAIRNSGTGTPDTPAGYTLLLNAANLRVFGRIAQSGDTDPTVTFTGGVANASCSARIAAFTGGSLGVVASTSQLNGSDQNIATPQLVIADDGPVLLLWVGWKADDATDIAYPAAATGLFKSWTTQGDDQSLCAAYLISASGYDTAVADAFAITGGTSQISRGGVLALRAETQHFTLTRGVNGFSKAHAADEPVRLWRPQLRGL